MNEEVRLKAVAAWHNFLHVQGFDVLFPNSFSKNMLADRHASQSNLFKAKANSKAAKQYNIPIGKMVVLKVFFTGKPQLTKDKDKKDFLTHLTNENSSLIYESMIYEKVTQVSELRDNVIKWIGFQSIDLTSIDNPVFVAKANGNIFIRSAPQTDEEVALYTINMTITEYNEGMTLQSFLIVDKNHLRDEFIVPILLQLLWCIRILQAHDIQHNDMHLGNIFIMANPDPTLARTYKTDYGETFVLPSNAPLVLLFDWDFANTSENKGPKASDPSYCEQFGICEPLNERRDIFRLLKSFYLETDNQDNGFYSSTNASISASVKKFLSDFDRGPIGKEKVAPKSQKIGYPCNQDPGNSSNCVPYDTGEPTQIHDSFFLLQSAIFKPYLVQSDQTLLAAYLTKRDLENAARISKPKRKKKLVPAVVAYYKTLETDWKITHPEKDGLDLVNYGIDLVQIHDIDCKTIVKDIFTTLPEFVDPQKDFENIMTPSPTTLQSVYACGDNGNLAVASSYHHPTLRKLRVTIFNQMLPFFREYFPQQNVYIQMVFGQLTAQRMGTKSSGSYSRLVFGPHWPDETKFDKYYTGYINLNDDYDYEESVVPGDIDFQSGVDHIFKVTSDDFDDYLNTAKKEFTVKSGQLVLMHRNLLRKNFNGIVPKTNFRLHVAWRISKKKKNGYDEKKFEDYFTNFSTVPIHNYRLPEMYPYPPRENQHEITEFAQTLLPSMREMLYLSDTKSYIDAPFQKAPSLKSLKINYPAYTEEEKSIFVPQLLNA